MADEEKRRWIWDGMGLDLMAVAGVVAIAIACWWVYPPLGLGAIGAFLVAGSVTLARRG